MLSRWTTSLVSEPSVAASPRLASPASSSPISPTFVISLDSPAPAALAVTRRTARLFTDGRYKTQADSEVQGAQVQIVASSPAIAAVEWLAAQPSAQSAGFDSAWTTVAELARFKAALPAHLRRNFLSPLAAPLVEPMRQIKDAEELALMSRAALLGCKLFDHILTVIRPGLPEIEIAAELEYKARLLGAEGMSFDTIVASGLRSALPHGRATATPLPRRGFLTLDFGIILGGYCSDMTRTVHLGSARARERETYQAVLESQQAGVQAVQPGALFLKSTRPPVASCGKPGSPTLSPTPRAMAWASKSTNPRGRRGTKIQAAPGMIVTIEPGVYFEGEFGIRIEDMVAVTESEDRC